MAVLYRSRADTKQKPLMWPDCLFGVVPQPTDSRLSETTVVTARAVLPQIRVETLIGSHPNYEIKK